VSSASALQSRSSCNLEANAHFSYRKAFNRICGKVSARELAVDVKKASRPRVCDILPELRRIVARRRHSILQYKSTAVVCSACDLDK